MLKETVTASLCSDPKSWFRIHDEKGWLCHFPCNFACTAYFSSTYHQPQW